MRISSVEDLLTEFRNVGLVRNREFPDFGHRPTEGKMYEGLTQELLERALFDQFDLRVCSGKIRSGDSWSNQVDCMLVTGNGTQIPHTPEFIYDVSQVIAVVEVTKTLSAEKLFDDMEKIRATTCLMAKSADLKARIEDPTTYRILQDAFRAVVRKPIPVDLGLLTEPQRLVLQTLLVDAVCPVRILWGYDGYKSELGFRKAFMSSVRRLGLGHLAIPNLVICDDLSIVKSNGMPFAPRREDRWGLCFSQQGLAMRNFVHVLWYRLIKAQRRDFLSIADGRVFGHNPLVSFCPAGLLETLHKGTSFLTSAEIPPEPQTVSLEEYTLLQHSTKEVDFSGESFVDEFRARCNLVASILSLMTPTPVYERLAWATLEELLAKITLGGLFTVEGNLLRGTTSRAASWVEAGALLAGEDRDGRFLRRVPEGLRDQLYPIDSDPSRPRGAIVIDMPDGCTEVLRFE